MSGYEVVVDLSNYKDRSGQKVDPGRYSVIVEDVELDTAKNSGNQMINVWLRVIGTEYDGMTIMDRLVLTEKSMFRLVGFMSAIGIPTPKKRMKLNIRQWIGRALIVDVEDDEYMGRVRSAVRGYYRPKKSEQAAAQEQAQSGDGDDLDSLVDPERNADPAMDEPQAKSNGSAGVAQVADRLTGGESIESVLAGPASGGTVDLDTLDL